MILTTTLAEEESAHWARTPSYDPYWDYVPDEEDIAEMEREERIREAQRVKRRGPYVPPRVPQFGDPDFLEPPW